MAHLTRHGADNAEDAKQRKSHMSNTQSRELGKALRHGAAGRCPNCGTGRLFRGFLTLHDTCNHCGLDLRRHWPSAGPALLSIAVAAAFLAPLLNLGAAIFGPNPVILALLGLVTLPFLVALLLRVIKGAMVGYLWSCDVINEEGQ